MQKRALEVLRTFAIASVKGAAKTSGGNALRRLFDKLLKSNAKASKSDQVSGKGDGWRYEVTLQQD
jgi:hypothetical protein